jgi:uncharacterized membrane protein
MNIRWQFVHWQAGIAGTLGTAGVVLAAILYPVAPTAAGGAEAGERVFFAEARAIIHQHCLACHSQWPTDLVLSKATGGVHFDTPAEMQRYAERILVRAVETKTMPFAGMKEMPDADREALGRWIRQGAQLE